MVSYYGVCTKSLDVNPKEGVTMLTTYYISIENHLLISKAIDSPDAIAFELKYPSGKIAKLPFNLEMMVPRDNSLNF